MWSSLMVMLMPRVRIKYGVGEIKLKAWSHIEPILIWHDFTELDISLEKP